ncbi:protein transport protein SEC31 homolog A-like isoform X2 [Rhododendron vialii]|uniref:protein transport protein SEC31 homolog A-like isoform X2 n=1 Tax=Rhododendron vialii TaxID=182163 RepID=UPI00265F122D|nr:protein transport protein SEC31 homolog A-like isoform X2 [Rhododendron vialii]XP_058219935.1 protein transport protein SEC31 homolog A-like isoform X2 [Rhododendron vialii]
MRPSSSEASENALVTQLSRHRAPVCGVEFNALTPNHLASGADKGCIWDIAKLVEALLVFLLSSRCKSTKAMCWMFHKHLLSHPICAGA